MKHNTRAILKALSASLTISLFVANPAIAPAQTAGNPVGAQGQEAAPPTVENSGINHQTTGSGPIVVKWRLRKLDGFANLMVNQDGTYLFSGVVKDKKPDRDLDIAIALKSSLGGVILFRYCGNATDGVQWSKQGQDPILKANFQTFAGKIDWDGAYRFPLTREGVAKLYEERERKLERLKKEEAEARKRHDEKVAAEKKKEREEEEQKQAAEAQAAAQRQQSGGGGGSSVGSVLGTVGTILGSILAFF